MKDQPRPTCRHVHTQCNEGPMGKAIRVLEIVEELYVVIMSSLLQSDILKMKNKGLVRFIVNVFPCKIVNSDLFFFINQSFTFE